jgi:hypothetical protein
MQERGIPPEDAGRSVVDGVKAESLFIWTHPSLALCEDRFHDQEESSIRQWGDAARQARNQPFEPAGG